MTPREWMDATSLPILRRRVLDWYKEHARDLPWRRTRDPYRIWISEIMLQQTTVATVLSRFDSFFERFPSIADLAASKEEAVLHQWQGLGYYRRAKNLHRAAQVIVARHGGSFPQDVEAIAELPGLGRYTANAIASFAFGQKLPIIEANTRRLWTRVCAADGDPAKEPLQRQLWELAATVLPQKNAADFNQAVMDLGSTICTPRRPDCHRCPLERQCLANESGKTEAFPQKANRRRFVDVEHVSVVVWDKPRRRVIVNQRPANGQWAGLWEFPRTERSSAETLDDAARRAIGSFHVQMRELGPVQFRHHHGIMHYRVDLSCYEVQLTGPLGRPLPETARWVALSDLEQLPLSSPQRRIADWIKTREAVSRGANSRKGAGRRTVLPKRNRSAAP